MRCLGGFEVRYDDRPVTGFESQKVRALLAYLACHRDRALRRDHLAGLLWPEKSEEAARRNLRQAIYNLKRAWPADAPPVSGGRGELRLNPELDCWLDVEAFERARRRGLPKGNVEPHYLGEAAELYRGDFLHGFLVRDSSELEHWLLSEQGRLREGAIETFQTLVESYLARGELRLGTRYADRLLAIDPLSEAAYRYYRELEASWQAALAGNTRLTLVAGEPGVGKSRLVRAFLDAVTSRTETAVLEGRCDDTLAIAYQPIAEVLRNLLTSEACEPALAAAPPTMLGELARLVPELRELEPACPRLPPITDPAALERLYEAVAGGLPVAVAEWINFLWDEGSLVYEGGRWRLASPLTVPAAPASLENLTLMRLRRMPSSTRRLATQGAVVGQRFDTELLRLAADEHQTVVDVGVRLLVEHWLVRLDRRGLGPGLRVPLRGRPARRGAACRRDRGPLFRPRSGGGRRGDPHHPRRGRRRALAPPARWHRGRSRRVGESPRGRGFALTPRVV